MATGVTSSQTQTAQAAANLDRLPRQVTVTDPAHPLFGCTFPLVSEWSPRGKSSLIVQLPNGQHRSLPRKATDIDPPDSQSTDRPSLPWISVRTILPVAQFVKYKLAATAEDEHADSSSAANPGPCATLRTMPVGEPANASDVVDPTCPGLSASTRSACSGTDQARSERPAGAGKE
jgi:hypothetical protein